MNSKEEARFEYKGFPCVIRLLPDGYRCGYVGLPKGIAVDTDKIDCHGNINYRESTLPESDGDGYFWIGFDCGHACDGRDWDAAKNLYSDDEEVMKFISKQEEWGLVDYYKDYPVVTLERCKNECQNIVEQILKRKGELQ
ncbi:hypothetical protein NSB24_02170 [Blautia coccoides]|uniref:hypothetical protein n=1 Tax=Blautia producta TaxID=33035 RepID=UPI002149D29C|nr:hypothetical protein [Blautia coccoides]MCR1985043.1 hypothetical protein [Blautia coccoides]